ncbi:ER lumen protein-retaining receptor [Durusdinium trenchii]|uniref:ER lumen protein-retaining receptor n=1 Tax=Durusdinium trenchii TaxID=1381693 RepID=A0ABP0JCG0_9DINO
MAEEAAAEVSVPPAPVDEADKPGNLRGTASRAARWSGHLLKEKLVRNYSWNIFRYIGDYLHLLGVFALLATLAKNRSCSGISRSTQILYFLVFVTRYLDLIDEQQAFYLVFFKITYIVTSIIVLAVFYKLDATYERQKDTCSLAVILVPCFLGAFLLAKTYQLVDILWTFSQFCEGFAMVPQYVFCYRDRMAKDIGVTFYVLSMGAYRCFYAANWIYKKVQVPKYTDFQSWLGGLIDILFFADYLLSFTGLSLLRSMVLKVDEKINEFKDKVEMKVLGSSSSVARDSQATGTELRQRRKADEAEEDIGI